MSDTGNLELASLLPISLMADPSEVPLRLTPLFANFEIRAQTLYINIYDLGDCLQWKTVIEIMKNNTTRL